MFPPGLDARLRAWSGTLLCLCWALAVVAVPLPGGWWARAGEVVLAVYLLLALARARARLLAVCGLLAAAVAALIWRWGHGAALEGGLRAGLSFAAFFVALQMLRSVAERHPRMVHVRRAARHVGPGSRRFLLLVAGHVTGAVFAAGAVALAASMLQASADGRDRKQAAEAALRGLGLALPWSPFLVALSLVASLTPSVVLWHLILLGLPMAAIGLVASYVEFRRGERIDLRQIRRALAPIQLIALVLVAGVAVAASVTPLSSVTIVALALPVVAALALAGRPVGEARRALRRTHQALAGLNEEVLLVTISMMFGQVVLASPEFGQVLAGAWLAGLPDAAYVAGTTAAVFGGAFIGLHPLVTVSVVVPLLARLATGCPPALIAAAALAGWGAANMVSVWAVPVLVAAHAFGVPTRQLVWGPNLAFAAAVAAAGAAVLAGLSMIL